MTWISPRDVYLLAVVALLKTAVAGSSLGWRLALAGAAGSAASALSRGKRRRAEAGLAAVLGHLSPDARRDIARQSFEAFWKETLACPPLSAGEARLAGTEIVGFERVQAALQAGRGAILVESNSFGLRTLAKQVLFARGIAVEAVHVAHHLWGFGNGHATRVRRRFVQGYFESCERQYVADIVYLPGSESLGFTKRLLTVLNRNGVVCDSGDGQTGRRHIPVDFLGRPYQFTTGLVNLARVSGAPLLPIFCLQDSDGQLKLIVEAALPASAGATRDQSVAGAMSHYAALLEAYVRRYPGQYRNWHAVGAA